MGSLGVVSTQSQETGLMGIFSDLENLVSSNSLIVSGLILVLLAVAIVLVWRRRR